MVDTRCKGQDHHSAPVIIKLNVLDLCGVWAELAAATSALALLCLCVDEIDIVNTWLTFLMGLLDRFRVFKKTTVHPSLRYDIISRSSSTDGGVFIVH